MAPEQKKKSKTSVSMSRRKDVEQEHSDEDYNEPRFDTNSARRENIESEDESDSSGGTNSSDNEESSEENLGDEHANVRSRELENSSDQSINKRGRGEACIDELWAMEGKILELELDAHSEVIGDNAAKFSTYLGIIARDGNRLPLTYPDWRLVPNTDKERIWEEVQANTNLPPSYKLTCLRRVSKLWRDWKSNVKTKYFTPNRHNTKRLLKDCPPRVDKDQWSELVQHWSKPEVKDRSKLNRRNRKKQSLPHRTGRKGFANLRLELTRKNGSTPSKLDVFLSSRQPKEGKSIDETTAKTIDMAKELTEKLSETEKNDVAAKDQIYHSLFGPEKPGRLRTHGIGASARQVRTTSVSMPPEWTKAIDDAVMERMDKFSNDLKAEIEVKFRDILDRKLAELLDRNVNMPVNNNPLREQVPERTNVNTTDDENFVANDLLNNSPSQAVPENVMLDMTLQNKDAAFVSIEGLEDGSPHTHSNSNVGSGHSNAYSGIKRLPDHSVHEEIQEQMQERSTKKKRKDKGRI